MRLSPLGPWRPLSWAGATGSMPLLSEPREDRQGAAGAPGTRGPQAGPQAGPGQAGRPSLPAGGTEGSYRVLLSGRGAARDCELGGVRAQGVCRWVLLKTWGPGCWPVVSRPVRPPEHRGGHSERLTHPLLLLWASASLRGGGLQSKPKSLPLWGREGPARQGSPDAPGRSGPTSAGAARQCRSQPSAEPP